MEAIEFVTNYPKYVKEIRSVVKDNLQLLIDELEAKDTHDLVTPDTWFPNESAARGFVWGMFINAVNIQSYKTIIIDIDEINSVEDMELFFALLYKEGISFHPETSLSEIVNTDLYGKQTIRTFTEEESERLDGLIEKCFEVAEKENVDIFQTAMRIQKLIWGEPKKKKQ
jgi:hypothetical protein